MILISVFAAFLVVVACVGFYQGFSRGKARLDAALPGVNKALKAPGVAEVRAAGCPNAMVMNASELASMMRNINGVAPELGVAAGVFCFGPDQLPDCVTVARAFASSPGHVPGGFFVTIERRPAPQRQVICTRRFSDSAEDLGEFGPNTLPN